MTFQAYLDNIKEKTGKTPADFKALAEQEGVYAPEMKAEDEGWVGAKATTR